jgi:hypothetical protein
MYSTTVAMRKLTCNDTESIHSSDKFALSGAILSDAETIGIYLPTIRINDKEVRDIDREYSIHSYSPIVGISLTAWDLDEGDSWNESEDDIKKGVAAIATAVKLVPGYGTVASAVISGVSAAVIGAVNIFNGWDKDDKLLEYNEWVNLPNPRAYVPSSMTHTIHFHGSDPIGYSSWDYALELEIRYEWQPNFAQGTPSQTDAAAAMRMFRHRADAARKEGFAGAFPNFHEAIYNHDHVGGTIFLRYKSMITQGVEWRDVPLAELGNPSLEDFGARMRSTQDYAARNGFVGGFPNFYHADYGSGIVCGTVLLLGRDYEWRDVRFSEIGNPRLDDVGARFRGVNDWAVTKGFVGAFPNFYHADVGAGRVGGTILIKQSAGEWRDVLLFRDP